MDARIFRGELDHSPTLNLVMLRYAHAFFNQVAQSAACAHLHRLEQRCCRWLLMTRDRMPSGDFLLTQEFLGMMLGVRRTSVTDVMGSLQKAGLIRYRRGHVTILDHEALQQRACECYEISKLEFDRLLGDTAICAPNRQEASIGQRSRIGRAEEHAVARPCPLSDNGFRSANDVPCLKPLQSKAARNRRYDGYRTDNAPCLSLYRTFPRTALSERPSNPLR